MPTSTQAPTKPHDHLARTDLIAHALRCIIPFENWATPETFERQADIGRLIALLRAGCLFNFYRQVGKFAIRVYIPVAPEIHPHCHRVIPFTLPIQAVIDKANGGDWTPLLQGGRGR